MSVSARNATRIRCTLQAGIIPAEQATAVMVILTLYQETTMIRDQATTGSLMHAVGRLFRVVICVLTGGFAFPHAFTEGMDLK